MVNGTRARGRLKTANARLTSLLLTMAGLALLAMTLLMVYNILARALFDAPVDGVVSIVEEALMVAIVYLALAAPIPISLRIVIDRLPAGIARIVDTCTWLMSIAVLLVAGWGSWERAIVSYERGERTVGLFSFPLYPYRFLVALGLLVTCFHVAVVGRRWVAGLSAREIVESELGHQEVKGKDD